MKPVGEPYAGNPHVRFDERGVETERWPHGPKQPRLSSTLPSETLEHAKDLVKPRASFSQDILEIGLEIAIVDDRY